MPTIVGYYRGLCIVMRILQKNQKHQQFRDSSLNSAIVGSLLYLLVVVTHPDIALFVGVLTHYFLLMIKERILCQHFLQKFGDLNHIYIKSLNVADDKHVYWQF